MSKRGSSKINCNVQNALEVWKGFFFWRNAYWKVFVFVLTKSMLKITWRVSMMIIFAPQWVSKIQDLKSVNVIDIELFILAFWFKILHCQNQQLTNIWVPPLIEISPIKDFLDNLLNLKAYLTDRFFLRLGTRAPPCGRKDVNEIQESVQERPCLCRGDWETQEETVEGGRKITPT